MSDVRSRLEAICRLPKDFHEAGVMTAPVLKAIHHHASMMSIRNSVETGCGKSTLLLSWLSDCHTVFTLEAYGDMPSESFVNVRDSNLLRQETVQFILGPSQKTVPKHPFGSPLDLALIDGPHGFPFPMLEYYFLYPHLNRDALLIVDDIHIPTVHWLYRFLEEDAMFDRLEVVEDTAFFRRTDQPTFDPFGDDWWLQAYNSKYMKQQGRWSGRLRRLARRFKKAHD